MTTSTLLLATLFANSDFPEQKKINMESGVQREWEHRVLLKQLIEIYASEVSRLLGAIAILGAIAVLGEHASAQKEIDTSIIEIKNLSRLVEQAGADLFAFVGQPPEESSKVAGIA